MKKHLSAFLSVLLCLNCFVMPVVAEEINDDAGTPEEVSEEIVSSSEEVVEQSQGVSEEESAPQIDEETDQSLNVSKDSKDESVSEQVEEEVLAETEQETEEDQTDCPTEIIEKYAGVEFETDSEELHFLQETYPACEFTIISETSEIELDSEALEVQKAEKYEAQETSDTLSRAEWIHRLVELFDLSISKEEYPDNYYPDIDSSTQYYEDLMSASQYGLIQIEAGKPFCPEDPLTRDFAVYTANTFLGIVSDDEIDFEDADQIPHLNDAKTAVSLNWFKTENNKFEPNKMVSAEESETIISSAEEILNGRKNSGEGKGFSFADYVKVIPDGIEIDYPEENRLVIKDYNGTITKMM